MKLTVNKERIIDGLLKAAAIIPAKAGAAYLRSIWLRAEEGHLSIMATDANIEFTGRYEAEVQQSGLVGVQGRSFVDLVRQLPNGPLRLSLDAGGKTLIDHRLRDRIDPFSARRRRPFTGDVQQILPEFFVPVKCEAVNGVDHQRHAGGPCGEPADNSRFGTVRMHHVIPLRPEQFFQMGKRLEIGERRDLPDQPRTLHDLQSGTRNALQQLPFRSRRWPRDQRDVVPRLQSAPAGEQRVLLRASDDHPGDDMADLHTASPVECAMRNIFPVLHSGTFFFFFWSVLFNI